MVFEIYVIISLKGKEGNKWEMEKKSEKDLTHFFHDFNKTIISNG